LKQTLDQLPLVNLFLFFVAFHLFPVILLHLFDFHYFVKKFFNFLYCQIIRALLSCLLDFTRLKHFINNELIGLFIKNALHYRKTIVSNISVDKCAGFMKNKAQDTVKILKNVMVLTLFVDHSENLLLLP